MDASQAEINRSGITFHQSSGSHQFNSMKKILFVSAIVLGSFTATFSAFAQDHGHFYVGAAGTNQNDQLIITNATDFATNTGYVKTLTFTNAGRYAGYFQGNITFEALSAFNFLGDPISGSAALGSWIHAQIVSVEGPANGVFSFWEAGATVPTINIPCGTTSTNTWHISNNNGAPETDPFGHIHNRRFTATTPGVYVVSFKALDRSSNGVGGGPIHTDSEILKVYFQAGINLASFSRTGNFTTATFGGMANNTFHLEANSDLSTTNWTSVDSIAGSDYFLTLSETNTASQRFYRLRVTSP